MSGLPTQSLNAWFRLLASFMDSDGNRKPRMMPVKAADCIALMAVILRNTNSLTNIAVASMPAMPLAIALQKTVKLWDTAATLSRVSDKTIFWAVGDGEHYFCSMPSFLPSSFRPQTPTKKTKEPNM